MIFAILGFIISAIISGLVIWVLVLKFKEKPLISDKQKFVNFMPQYTSGFAKGNIIKILPGNKRTGILFMPTDIDIEKLKDDKTLVVEPQLIWVKHKIQLSKGQLSANQDEIWGLPQSSSGFDDEFQKTHLGQALMNIIENKNEKLTSEKLMIQRLASLEKIASKTYGNEIIDDFGEKVQEILADVSKLTSKDKQKSLFDNERSS